MKTAAEIKKAILNYFEEHEDEFIEVIEDLDSWNGYLGDDRIYDMDELNEIYAGTDADEILRRAFYGYDAETWHTDAHGEKEYGAFNPNRNYFYYNGYGNLVSCDYKDYSDKLDDYFIDELVANWQRCSMSIPAEVDALIEDYEEAIAG